MIDAIHKDAVTDAYSTVDSPQPHHTLRVEEHIRPGLVLRVHKTPRSYAVCENIHLQREDVPQSDSDQQVSISANSRGYWSLGNEALRL